MLLGQQLTKFRQELKAKLEDNFQYGGQRNATQARGTWPVQIVQCMKVEGCIQLVLIGAGQQLWRRSICSCYSLASHGDIQYAVYQACNLDGRLLGNQHRLLQGASNLARTQVFLQP